MNLPKEKKKEVGQQMFLLSNTKWVKTKNSNPHMYRIVLCYLIPSRRLCQDCYYLCPLVLKNLAPLAPLLPVTQLQHLQKHIVVTSRLWSTAVLQISNHFHQNKGGSSGGLWFISAPCILFSYAHKDLIRQELWEETKQIAVTLFERAR